MESISPVTNQSSGYDQSRRKRKKKQPQQPPSQSSVEKWRSEKQQQIYSTNIIQSLRKLRISSAVKPPSPRGGGIAVRDAAYRSLAVTARGRTLWSRALLSKAVKLKFRKQNRMRNSNCAITGNNNNRLKKKRATVLRLKGKGLPAVQRKVKLLSRLIPGCRKQPLPVVLEETTDYIVAMEMQIRALNALISAVAPPTPPSETGHDGEETHMLDTTKLTCVKCAVPHTRTSSFKLTPVLGNAGTTSTVPRHWIPLGISVFSKLGLSTQL
ncbi:hypothetical protein ARALYDRAFT_915148 [Arabidopsis lyrata subsp. lyrata]|uniref:BHLH domain-containing protein n=1 Tax=Arabidopsis lyrata subsp. lyrata TaxID=81972 RepID=D7M9Z1_ARALL|nr:hypothetical protein ARALYDRAFT_915148 [Arabidopsis lyrata subsp. lyrata]